MHAPRRLVLVPLFASCAALDRGHDMQDDARNAAGAPIEATVASADGVPIHYVAFGRGEPALVFVHGWLGNAGWWRATMDRFAATHRVVALDLAGHGGSGRGRADWTVERFADDVIAVVQALELREVVLLGHSMSGAITVEAARRLPERVVALVPVDTLQDADWDLPEETWRAFFGGLRADFPAAVEGFFRTMLTAPESPADVIDRIVAEARAADPTLAVPMLERAREYDLRAALRALAIPIHALEAERSPANVEGNRKYARRFDASSIPGVGHWPMLEAPQAFGDALERVLGSIARAKE